MLAVAHSDGRDVEQQTASLHILPIELLLHICDDSGFPKNILLYQLSRVSRYFHNICIHHLLPRYGILNASKYSAIVIPSGKGEAPEQMLYPVDGLSALRLALSVTEIQELTCTFPDPGLDFHDLVHHMERLQSLITRLTKVEKVTLTFDKDVCYCKGDETGALLVRWAYHSGRLLNTILEKGCTCLTVRGARYLVQSYTLHVDTAKRATVAKTLAMVRAKISPKPPHSTAPIQVMRGDGWRFHRGLNDPVGPKGLTRLSPAAQKATVLRSMEISSSSCLLPPLLQWTIHTLQASLVEELILSGITLSYELWQVVFSLIADASPMLGRLVLKDIRHVMADSLFEFISRLRELKCLTIGEDLEYIDRGYSGRLPKLLSLTSLSAPSVWVEKLFNHSGLPRLQDLTMSYHLRDEGYPMCRKYSSVNSVLEFLKRKDRSLPVHLRVTLEKDLTTWLSEEIYYAHKAHNFLEIQSLSLIIHRDYTEDQDIREIMGKLVPEWLKRFHQIRYLSIENKGTTILTSFTLLNFILDSKVLRHFPYLRGIKVDGQTLLDVHQVILDSGTSQASGSSV
ncbi:hypothetical protein B0H34DRAFT_10590 [Crassisporium funariophilum]|nr:hypothetical protein B0H34DRAFT_10590 [Crassisporium funariophilum]